MILIRRRHRAMWNNEWIISNSNGVVITTTRLLIMSGMSIAHPVPIADMIISRHSTTTSTQHDQREG